MVSLPGMSSGIDTTSLISQLMAVAAKPEDAIKTQLAAVQGKLTEYSALQTKFRSLQDAADALSLGTAFTSTKATSSSTSVAVTSSTTAQPGTTTTFDVLHLAAAQISTLAVPSGGVVLTTPANGFDIVDSAGATHHLTPTDGTASSVAAAVNSAGLGVKAALINTDTGQVLQFTSTTSGSSGSFAVNGLDSSPQTLVAAQNAQIAVGNPAAGGYTVSSSTNTFTNVIPGVTLTVSGVATGVSVSIGADTDTPATKMKAFVDAANSVLTELKNTTAKGGTLQANGTINGLVQNVLSVVSNGTAGASFSAVGVQLTKDGLLTFDQATFTNAYTTNASSTTTVAKALTTSMSSVAFTANTSTLGSLVTSGNSQVSSLQADIARWDKKLAAQQDMLTKKFSAMDTILNKLNSQSSWLTAQLAAITNSSNTSK